MQSAAHRRAQQLRSVRLRDLAVAQRRLVELMRRVGFGEIRGLSVRGGQPSFDPAPRVLRKILIGGENGEPLEVRSADYELKGQIVELLEHLARLGSGTADIEVRGGLPVRAILEGESVI